MPDIPPVSPEFTRRCVEAKEIAAEVDCPHLRPIILAGVHGFEAGYHLARAEISDHEGHPCSTQD